MVLERSRKAVPWTYKDGVLFITVAPHYVVGKNQDRD